MGHRLTIAMNSWLATVRWSSGEPAEAELTVEVDSLQVLDGEGGVKALSGPEKALSQSNALRALDADRFPQIRFHASDIHKVEGGYRLAGTLEVHGVTAEREIGLRVEDLGEAWRLSCEAAVRQSDFGMKPSRFALLPPKPRSAPSLPNTNVVWRAAVRPPVSRQVAPSSEVANNAVSASSPSTAR